MTQTGIYSTHPDAVHIDAGKMPAHQGSSVAAGAVPPGCVRAVPSGVPWVGASAPAQDQAASAGVLAGGACVALTKAGLPCKGRSTATGRCMAHN